MRSRRGSDRVREATTILDEAARVDPVSLRTLDAIHLAAAVDLGDDLDAIVTYDERLVNAGRSIGIAIVAPSRWHLNANRADLRNSDIPRTPDGNLHDGIDGAITPEPPEERPPVPAAK